MHGRTVASAFLDSAPRPLTLLRLAGPMLAVVAGHFASAFAQGADAPSSQAEWVVTGQATDAVGAGIPGVALQVEEGGSQAAAGRVLGRAATDQAGDFRIRLPGEPRGALYLRAARDRYAPFHIAVEFPPDEREAFVAVELEGALSVRGRVLDAVTRRPLADAILTIDVQGREAQARSDANGRFEVRGVSEGEGILTVSREGFGRERRPLRIEADMSNIEVQLYRERTVRLRLVDERGVPVPDAEVELRAVGDLFSATTDADGRADVRGISREVTEIRWRAGHPDGVRMLDFDRVIDLSGEASEGPASRPAAASSPATTQSLVRTIVLPRGGKVAGRATDADTGEPVLTARIMVADTAMTETWLEWTDGDGQFALTGIVPAPIVVAVHHPDYAPELIEDEVRAGWTRRLPIRLSRGRLLAGHVVDEQGKAAADVQVVCTRWRNREAAGLRTITDKNGRFAFEHAPEGPIEFAFHKPGGGRLEGRTLVAGTTDYRITLPAAASRPARPSGSQTAAPGGLLTVGKPAPDVSVRTLEGTAYRLSGLRGKYVFVDIWATWCPPCRAEMPVLRKLHADLASRSDFVMIGISLDEDADTVRAFAEKEKIGWPLAAGPGSGAETAAEQVGARFIPFNFLVGPDGRIVAIDIHGPELPERIRGLLKSAATRP